MTLTTNVGRDAASGGGAPDDRLLGARTRDLAAHRRRSRRPPLPERRPRRDVITAIDHAGLRGRGGGAFPTGRKLHAVAERRGRKVVVVNGSEGEPASSKDVTLLRDAPHLVLDGAAWAASAVAADRIVVAIERTDTTSARILTDAIAGRASEGGLPVELALLPPRYVAGEEHALVAWINGHDAKPTYGKVYEHGVNGLPTLVDNVETLAHAAQIASFGPAWFRRFGTGDEPGTMLTTVSGAIARPGVFEVPIGMPLGDLVRAAGGATAEPGAVLLGGYYGSWLPRAQLADARLSNEWLRPRGAGLGCGAVVVLGNDACGLRESARILEWLASQSAGQCGPCVHGLGAVSATMTALALGRADTDAVDRLHRWAAQIEHRGACSFPDGAIRFLRSALHAFADDVARHARGQVCDGARRPAILRVPAPDHGGEWR